MRAFLRETLQLLYYAYFKPSALQVRLNEAAPQKEGDTAFWRLSFDIIDTPAARRFLLRCTLWWLLGLVPFWWLAWGLMPWGGMLIISGGLLLGAWGISFLDLPLSLAFPLIAGLVWGMRPDLWPTWQAGMAPRLNWGIVWWLGADLSLGAALGGGGAAWATSQGHKRLAAWWAGLTTFAAVGVAGVVAGVVAGGVAGGMTLGVAVGVALVVAVGAADEGDAGGVAGIVAGGVAGVVALGVAVGVASGVTGGVAVGVASGVTGGVAVGVAVVMGVAVAGVVAYVVAVVVAVGVVVIVAVGVAGGATLPLAPALGFALGLGVAFSPRRSLWPGLILPPVVAALFIAPQGWGIAGLALLSCLVGYFRLPLYPLALLAASVAGRARLGSIGANARVRRLPPFTDEVVWLPLFGLDKLLVAAVEEDAERGREAIEYVSTFFSQGWAARAALLQWSSRVLSRYHTVEQIPTAPGEFAWLPDEADESLRGVVEVRRRVEEIARQVEAALGATSDYNRLRRLNQAYASVQDLRQSFAALKGRAPRRFVPVAEGWDRLISDEIARLSAEEEIKAEIPNPYITGIPVQPDETDMFAPRPDLAQAVENALTAIHGKPTLALYGPRRMGKTTFLLHLPRLLPDEVVPVFVDLQEATQVSGLGGLYYNWATAAFEAARDRRRQTLPRPALADFHPEPAIAWREWLDEAERALGARVLFFTFDEFERLVDAAEKNAEMEGAFSILRHLSQHRPRVYLLFAGAHRLQELAPGGRWHDYFINVRGLEVSYLAEPDARRLLTNPIPDFPLDYAPGTLDEMIRLTRCQPLLVQLMGSILVDWLNSRDRRQQGDRRTATLDDVAYAADQVLSVGRSAYFANLWNDAGDDGRRVLGVVAQSPDGLAPSELAHKTGLSADELPAVLARMEQYRLVEEIEDRWQVQVELTRRAFARRAKTDLG